MRARVVDPFAPVRRRTPRRTPAPQTAAEADQALPGGPPVDLTNGLLGVAAAAEALGMTKREVGEACREGTLPCTKAENGRWLIDVPAALAARSS